MAEQQCPLPEIIQHQRGKDEPEPGSAQRRPSEMPHIGVKRLGPGHREKHRSEHQEPAQRVFDEHRHAVDRVQREQHMRLVNDAPDPERRQDGEPHQHDRAEHAADDGGAAALHQKQADQQHQCDRHDIGLEQRGRDLEALDRAQYRNRRRDHAVAVEQRGADQPRPMIHR